MLGRHRNLFIVGGICVAGILVAASYILSNTGTPQQKTSLAVVDQPTSTASATPIVTGSTTVPFFNVASSTISNENLTATDKLAQSLFAQYIQARQTAVSSTGNSDPQVDDNTQQAIVQELASEQGQIISPRVYTAIDISISDTETPTSITQYGLALGKIMVTDSASNLSENEFDILNNAVTGNDQNEITKMDPIIKSYEKVIADTLKLQIPSSAEAADLDYLNSLSQLLASIQGMRQYFTDPATAFAGLQAYGTAGTNLQNAINELSGYFNREGVTFGENSYGNIFMQNI